MVINDQGFNDLRKIIMIPQIIIKFKQCLLTVLLIPALVLPAGSLLAQGIADSLRGSVSDEWGNPLTGIDIRSVNGKNGSSNDVEGQFTIAVTDGSNYRSEEHTTEIQQLMSSSY